MKVKFYIDLSDSNNMNRDNLKDGYLMLTMNPGIKTPNYKRVRVEVDLPDRFFSTDHELDAFVESVSVEGE